MLTGDEASLGVIGEAVCHTARSAPVLHAVRLVPAADDVSGHVAEEEVALRVPDGTLGPTKTRSQLLHLGGFTDEVVKG